MNPQANVLTAQDQALFIIRLNRPSVLNALSDELMRELHAALEHARHDEQIRAILITGEGRGFCAGADLAASALASPRDASSEGSGDSTRASGPDAMGSDVGDKLRLVFNPVIEQMRQMPKPIVTAINGVAAGAGMSLAMAGD
ncbi:MAG: hypothetical protein EBW55_04185, partial [Betaproteobacteria bacterium]|nr:hypothetical protein [Betaproteobacteria bacterium]